MIKWSIRIVVLLAIALAAVYIWFPAEPSILQATDITCTPNGTHRALTDTTKWKLWWPRDQKTLSYKGYNFTIGQKLIQGIDVNISRRDFSASSRIVIMPEDRDSITLIWQCKFPSTKNPFKRISNYNQAVELKEHFASIFSSLKTYLENPTNVYGYSITQTSTKDTMLVAARASSTGTPSMQQVYGLVNQLKEYAKQNGALQTGFPMLNVTPAGNNQFQFMVAVPVNKELPAKGNIFARRMVPGNFMMTETKGGPGTVDDAMKQLQQFTIDHQRTSMAIPFQVMVTDRIQEQDTSKWVTKIYYPVM